MSIRNCLKSIFYHMPTMSKWPHWMLKRMIEYRYQLVMGEKLDLNNVKTFNEKIQWYMLNYDNSEICKVTDKYQFKTWVAEKLHDTKYTARLYGNWTCVEDLIKDWDSLPEEFVLKSNNSYNGNFIKFVHNKEEVDLKELAVELKEWFDPHKTCMHNIGCRFNICKLRILAEEFLKQDGHSPNDYKLYCFNGKPYCVYVATDHFVDGQSAISFYDLNWNMLDVRYGDYLAAKVGKPEHLEEMIDIAKKLSAGFPFVRVDFFDLNGKLYLSELTFDSGWGHRKFNPEAFDLELGNQFILDKKI